MGEQAEAYSVSQSKDNFISILNDFLIFLKITADDLKAKRQTLKLQNRILVEDKKAKMYIKCQIIMLKQHILQLEGFNTQIKVKLNIQRNTEAHNDGQICDNSNQVMHLMNAQFSQVPDIIIKNNLSDSAPSRSTLSIESLKKYAPKCDELSTINVVSSSSKQCIHRDNKKPLGHILNNVEDEEVNKWVKDLRITKKYCKHILDITDKYCVVSNEKDLNLNVMEDEIASNFNSNLCKYPEMSRWTAQSSRCNSPNNSHLLSNKNIIDTFDLLQLPVSLANNGWMKMTFLSFWYHITFLIKTQFHKCF